MYQITRQGAETLEGWLTAMISEPATEFTELPVALAFLMVLSPEEALRQLEGGLPRLFIIEDEYKQAMMEAELTWLRSLIADLRSKEITWSREWLRKIAP